MQNHNNPINYSLDNDWKEKTQNPKLVTQNSLTPNNYQLPTIN